MKDGIRTSKVKKVNEIRSIEALEALASSFVSHNSINPLSHDFIDVVCPSPVGTISALESLYRSTYFRSNKTRHVHTYFTQWAT